jgi:Thrombospondin type 3 repeat
MRLRLPYILVLAVLVLAAPAAARAALFEYDGSFGSGVNPDGRFAQASGIAIDEAGRVFVADAAGGRVEVFDNAENGNTFLGVIADGVTRPTGVAVDNRNRLDVADAAANVIDKFDSFNDGGDFLRVIASSGQALGELQGPQMLDTDSRAYIYVAETGNTRVQFFNGNGGPILGFGVGDPAPFNNPYGLARTPDGFFYVSNDEPGAGGLRAYDSRGFLLRTLASPGTAPGQVDDGRGVARDRLGRVVVVDAGQGRVEAFNSYQGGSGFLGSFGSPGSGPGQFNSPAGAAMGPGAILYVADAGNGRVVRLRFDDTDHDGVLDGADNCPGVPNAYQQDSNRNGVGDACDPAPASKPRRLSRGMVVGTAGGRHVARVEVAIARVSRGGRCAWYSHGAFGRATSCARPVYLRTSGVARWTRRVAAAGAPGRYRVLSRALPGESRPAVRTFRVG